jgi:class 3 adenylate cyclase
MNSEIDVRAVLPTIRVPTLLLHGERDYIPVEGARYMADRIPGARLVELPGMKHLPVGEESAPFAAELERFLREVDARGGWTDAEAESESVLATVLFTDLVGSTAKAALLGDRGWRALLEQHHARVREQLARFRGTEIDTAGDGFFARFDGPARGIRCAEAITKSLRELDLDVRAGLHTGECELVDGKVAGITVAIGARVAAHAGPGEVLVSQTVKDLVAGSRIAFSERGISELKGVPGEWKLFAVESA